MNAQRNNEQGFALVTVIIFSLVLLIAGLAMVVLSATESMIVHNNKAKGVAFYAAEGGLEKQIADIYDLSVDGTIPTPSELLSISQIPPDFEGYTFPEYGVERDGDDYLSTITVGPYAGLFALVQPYRMVSRAVGPGNVETRVERWSEHHLIPIFQFGIFYDQDLEVFPGPEMTIGGRVHANGNLHLGANEDLYFSGAVTSSGDILLERKDGGGGPAGRVYIMNDQGSYRQMTFDSRDPQWEDKAIQTWGGRVLDSSHGIVDIGLPLPVDVEPIEIIKRGEEEDNAKLRDARFYYQADLKIIDGVATDDEDDPVDLDENILSTYTFYNFREEKWLTATQLDIAALINADQVPENRILYISASETSPGALDAVIRLVNGDQVPTGGLTVATNNPLYIWGDFNTIEPQPSSVLTDAFNVLSNAWVDSLSDESIGSRRASETTVRVGVIAGTMWTTPGNYNGGIENFPRFLEDWSGRDMTYIGSLICMWVSEWATGTWEYGGGVYTSPKRVWSFDESFYDPDLLPPGCPNIMNFEPGEWIYD